MELDPELGEVAWADEEVLAAEMAAAITGLLQRKHRPGEPVRRDAHPKAHGCVRAELRVESSLPAGFAEGVFVPGHVWSAWVRFSNGNPDADRPDHLGDARGMAIKLVGVPGEKVLPEEKDATTQDFVLISHPVFFADEPRRYARLLTRGASPNPLVKATAPLALGWRGARIARDITRKTISSPLETRYWSTVPFRLGTGPTRQAVKYSARPTVPAGPIPDQPAPDYLRRAMVDTLRLGEATFDFLVQPRAGPWMSVEDPRIEWSETDAPFVKVATLVIPRQAFDTSAQNEFCEDLSFTPWHALPAHRPLGGVNRARRVVYEAVSALRHQMNGTVRREPAVDDVLP